MFLALRHALRGFGGGRGELQFFRQTTRPWPVEAALYLPEAVGAIWVAAREPCNRLASIGCANQVDQSRKL